MLKKLKQFLKFVIIVTLAVWAGCVLSTVMSYNDMLTSFPLSAQIIGVSVPFVIALVTEVIIQCAVCSRLRKT